MASIGSEDIDSTGLTGDPTLDGLLFPSYWSLYAQERMSFTITDDDSDYRDTRDGEIDSYPDVNYLDVYPMPGLVVAGIRGAIAQFEQILPFAIPEEQNNDVDTKLRFGITKFERRPASNPAYAWNPQEDSGLVGQANWKSGDIFLNTINYGTQDPIVGTIEYFNLDRHETGHALGLKHGHEEDEGFPPLPEEWTPSSSRS